MPQRQLYHVAGGELVKTLSGRKRTPEWLYHYTSVETFLKILESKKVLFNRLDRVLDLTEGRSPDLGPLGIYQFVSCWTECPDESLTLWGFYPSGLSGLRIGLPRDMFETYEQASDRYRGLTMERGLPHVLPLDERIRDDLLVGPVPPEFPHQMLYTDDADLLAPNVAERPDTVEFGKLGVCKASDWAFEQEWRFRLFVMPHPIPADRDFGSPTFAVTVAPRVLEIFNSRRVRDTHLFCSINRSALEQMEVLLGPCTGTEERRSVEQALQTWNPSSTLSVSRYAGQIRCG
jgi:hypothetical protein